MFNTILATKTVEQEKPTFFIVDYSTRKRIASAYTSRGILAIVTSKGYKIIDSVTNEFYGIDVLVENESQ